MNINKLHTIVLEEYSNIVESVLIKDSNELRIIVIDSSYIDVWFSPLNTGKYSYHWERKAIDGTIYRHDNTPHLKWKFLRTFPKHFHKKTENNVKESYLNDLPENAIREVMNFVRNTLHQK